jgi:hypothetical protein
MIENNTSNSLITFRLTVALLVPATFEAWHWYMPWSSSLTLVMLRELPAARTWNLGSTIATPFRVQLCSGMGLPVAVQRRVVTVPVTAVTMVSSAIISGPTGRQKTLRFDYTSPFPTHHGL